jgi:glycine/D-amino acid oxidase-like deaminating enzyme/nitrite reductase/ring-hydroxylating ferredoxin subunit
MDETMRDRSDAGAPPAAGASTKAAGHGTGPGLPPGTRSLWARSRLPTAGPLEGNASADVCIVGAGVAGLTTGLLLAREGRSVVILDDGPPGEGETLRTTAHLTRAIDDRIFTIARLHGAKNARAAVDASAKAIDRIEEICETEGIPGFRRVDGHLFCGPDDDVQTLVRELKAAQKAGLDNVRLDAGAPLPFETGPCLVFPDQGEVDAGAYLAGLARAFADAGGVLFTPSHATKLTRGKRPVVETPEGRVECGAVVLATNVPTLGRADLSTKQSANRTYVCAYSIPRRSIRRGLYWETGMPYHFVRLADQTDSSDLLIVGGDDHRTGQEDQPHRNADKVDTWARARFNVGDPVFQWSGQIMEPADHLPFIGLQTRHAKNVYVISGDSGQGYTNGTAGAMIVTDLIQGRFNIWAEAFAPYRPQLRAIATRVKQNLKSGKHMVEHATPGDAPRVESLARGQEAVIREGAGHRAVYRDEAGNIHACSAVCQHIGCLVHWNPFETSWDCPCHGSRYAVDGSVLSGPTNKPLQGAEEVHVRPPSQQERPSRAAGRRARPAHPRKEKERKPHA